MLSTELANGEFYHSIQRAGRSALEGRPGGIPPAGLRQGHQATDIGEAQRGGERFHRHGGSGEGDRAGRDSVRVE